MSAVPGPIYGLEVPPGEVLIPASMEIPASVSLLMSAAYAESARHVQKVQVALLQDQKTDKLVPQFRITMAALDPTEQPEADQDGNIPSIPRSTLRIVKRAFPGLDDDDDEDEDEDEYLQAMLEDSDEDDEPNGGPSDPAKAKKRKQDAAIKKLLEAAQNDEDEEMEDAKPNGTGANKSKGKGKAKATDEDDDDDDEDDEDDDDSDAGADLENFVVCTLDTERNYQQPLNITVNHGEKVFFVVTGTHTVYLTGNYIMDDDDEDDDDDDYDPSLQEIEYNLGADLSDADSDDMDGLDDPRIEELDSDEEEAPQLVEAKKGKNKRPAENLDDMIADAEDGTLSKKQQKKLKNNKGDAVAADDKKDKKVQFAKNLEQGPTGSADKAKEGGKAKEINKASVGIKVVQGVTIDDRTIGKGRTVKNGDTVGVRYIGKLANGQQFDANKKGKPFSFKVGKGQVIKGWDIGIVGMAIGGERRLIIPAQAGYGSRGMPGIPPNSQLTFDVKLLEIK
ncbi:hypothetical protein CDD81_2662 [Ophiocordyceps australis]|uniref:peptidylprolyl isomerase n=1 Tax=Ophiocordyceps australis TaxID=1399860 RepID=A0A2C5XX47_9HYPO|nr:hypothetical protein CDD81_2662 [Ophiocordyceps australis]